MLCTLRIASSDQRHMYVNGTYHSWRPSGYQLASNQVVLVPGGFRRYISILFQIRPTQKMEPKFLIYPWPNPYYTFLLSSSGPSPAVWLSHRSNFSPLPPNAEKRKNRYSHEIFRLSWYAPAPRLPNFPDFETHFVGDPAVFDLENLLQRAELKLLNQTREPESIVFDYKWCGPLTEVADGRGTMLSELISPVLRPSQLALVAVNLMDVWRKWVVLGWQPKGHQEF